MFKSCTEKCCVFFQNCFLLAYVFVQFIHVDEHSYGSLISFLLLYSISLDKHYILHCHWIFRLFQVLASINIAIINIIVFFPGIHMQEFLYGKYLRMGYLVPIIIIFTTIFQSGSISLYPHQNFDSLHFSGM